MELEQLNFKGSGTKEDPFQVETVEQLDYLGELAENQDVEYFKKKLFNKLSL